ncbi:ABC-2 transporter permease [Collinsella stercoris]|uniref:ABC-2 transporter permease n=1 Tax=Collinsella stercoris TaxID=147206 RepID=UPI003A91D765
MLRMMKMELAVLKKYLKQITFTMLIVIVCLVAGMGSLTSVPGVAFLMVTFSASMSASAYDDQNGWGSYRLVMPVTRREVVQGRYALNLLLAIAAAAVAAVLMTAFIALGSAVELPEFLANLAVWDNQQLEATLAASISCACIGLCMCSATLPAYFKFGMTKATQYLPFIMLFLSVAPFLVLGVIGGPLLDQVKGAIELAETTGGLGLIAFAALAISLAVYAASSFIAVRLYSARDL